MLKDFQISDLILKKLRWRCRRGMQELDTLLNSYLDRYYAGLDESQIAQLILLLQTEDDILWVWLSGQQACDTPQFADLINDIRHKD